MIGESTDFTSQAVAFGYLGLAFGVGTVLGPLVGGALSMPCENIGPGFPLCGEGQLNAVRWGRDIAFIHRSCHTHAVAFSRTLTQL